MKKLMILSAVAVVAAMGITASAVNVEVNGTRLDTDAVIVNDRTLVPLRAVANALNCGVGWNEQTKGISLYSTDNETQSSLITCWIGKENAFKLKNLGFEKSYKMETVPQIIDDRTYVPLRAVSELMGADVSWNGETSTAVVTGEMPVGATDEEAQLCRNVETGLFVMYDAYSTYAQGKADTVKAEIELADGGIIALDLYKNIAPLSVANFVKLADEKFYDGLTFHRVINGFMIQGGGYDDKGEYKSAENITGEFFANGWMNFISHEPGIISMARANDPNSGSSQFFIVHKNSDFLDGQYAAFGKVTSGMEYVDKIAAVETDSSDKPLENVVIKTIRITER